MVAVVNGGIAIRTALGQHFPRKHRALWLKLAARSLSHWTRVTSRHPFQR